jgi:hypothetical protein
MLQERNSFEEAINEQLNDHLKRLEALRQRHLQAVRLHAGAQKTRNRKAEEKEREIEALFDEYMNWIEDTMTTEKQAYIKVVAVMGSGLSR